MEEVVAARVVGERDTATLEWVAGMYYTELWLRGIGIVLVEVGVSFVTMTTTLDNAGVCGVRA